MSGVDAPPRLRPYRADDAPALADIYRRSVRALGPRDYSPRQVEAWAALAPDPEALHARLSDGRTALVAVGDDDRPVGFGDLERDGHIDLLYVAPEAAGTGLGRTLVGALEAAAREAGVERLHLEASAGARRLLERMGFRVLHRRALVIGDVPIHNFAMEKRLDDARPEDA